MLARRSGDQAAFAWRLRYDPGKTQGRADGARPGAALLTRRSTRRSAPPRPPTPPSRATSAPTAGPSPSRARAPTSCSSSGPATRRPAAWTSAGDCGARRSALDAGDRARRPEAEFSSTCAARVRARRDRLARQLVGALVERRRPGARARRRAARRALHDALASCATSSWLAFAFQPLEHADGVLAVGVHDDGAARSAGIHSSARRMAVSSATLFVASPRYSNPSCILPPGATEHDARPGGPRVARAGPVGVRLHAPAGTACGTRRRLRDRARSLAAPQPGAQASSGSTTRPGDDHQVAARRAVGSAVVRLVADLDATALRRRAIRRLRARASTLWPRSVASIHGIVPLRRLITAMFAARKCDRAGRPRTARARHPRRLRRARGARRQRRPPRARRPRSPSLLARYPHSLIGTSGPDVGLPPGQMGNSEVGHLNFGAGRIAMMDISRIDNAVHDGTLAQERRARRRRRAGEERRRPAAPARAS